MKRKHIIRLDAENKLRKAFTSESRQRLADIREAKTVRGDNHKPLSAKPLRVRY